MPRVNIWIRKEDMSTWESIGNKSQWISVKLNAAVRSIGEQKSVSTIIKQPVELCKKHDVDKSICKLMKH